MRVGMGYDVHKLVEGRDLIIGGVKIPHTLGLLGHSDADVLLHAIMDALLGAAALGDIGKHFPDTDPKYKGISSMKLLEHVAGLIAEKGYIVENIDATIIAQKPKMRPHIEQMEKNIAAALKISEDQINVKATTEEGLGFTGREQGILAGANVVMPNLSPTEVRKDYLLYDNKICTGDESAQCKNCLAQRMESVGYHVVVDRGDSLNK